MFVLNLSHTGSTECLTHSLQGITVGQAIKKDKSFKSGKSNKCKKKKDKGLEENSILRPNK